MKRNQKKMTFIAALCLLAAISTACQKQPQGEEVIDSIEVQSEEPSQEVTFQDQYDLGMRLLSEGSYEEAIIAFTAALEIDPRSVDVYTALADAYEAMGDTEGLRRILEQGIEATGDAGLQERLSKLPPQLPEGLPLFEEGHYVASDGELESILFELIETGLAGGRDILEDAAWNAQLAEQVKDYLKAKSESSGERVGNVSEGEDNVTYEFWTMLPDDSLLHYSYTVMGQGLNHEIFYRPQSGDGFYSRWEDYLAAESPFYNYKLVSGHVEGWFFNGAFTQLCRHIQFDAEGNESGYDIQLTGTAADDLVDGERVTQEEGATKYEVFEAGMKQSAWTDENGSYDVMRVDEAGEVRYFDTKDTNVYRAWDD